VLTLRFETEATWRACCDPTAMRGRWGHDLSRCISRRLQQLEAMTSLDDLAFMPFDSVEHPDGLIEIALDDDTSLFVREVGPIKEDERLPATLVMISAVGAQTMTAV
jgi:hypothetical protein